MNMLHIFPNNWFASVTVIVLGVVLASFVLQSAFYFARTFFVRLRREIRFSRLMSETLRAGSPPDLANLLGLYQTVFPDLIKPKGNLEGLMRREVMRLHFSGIDEKTLAAVRLLTATITTRECFDRLPRENARILATIARVLPEEAAEKISAVGDLMLFKEQRFVRQRRCTALLLFVLAGFLLFWSFPGLIFLADNQATITPPAPPALQLRMDFDE